MYVCVHTSFQHDRKRLHGRSVISSITLPAIIKGNQTKDHSIPSHSKRSRHDLINKVQPTKTLLHSISSSSSSSATARLANTRSSGGVEVASQHYQQRERWHFINRYTHRSNGGIPMFSEERLRERAERTMNKSCAMAISLPQLHHTQTDNDDRQREVMNAWAMIAT